MWIPEKGEWQDANGINWRYNNNCGEISGDIFPVEHGS